MFIWTDIETTGLDPARDRILALGAIITDDSFREIARDEWVVYVPAEDAALQNMDPHVREMHTKSGLLEGLEEFGFNLHEVEAMACAFIDAVVGDGPSESIKNRPCMAGNSVAFDREFIREHLPELHRRYNYRLLDVSTLKVLALATVPGAREWNDSRPEAPHTPLADLEGSISELAHWRGELRR